MDNTKSISFIKNIEIPDKKYLTIGEISKLFQIRTHVFRYWEKEFTDLKPIRRGKRRYYQKKDVLVVRRIKNLLYNEGYTIKGARTYLSSMRKNNNILHNLENLLEILN